MQLRLRYTLSALALLLSAACGDSPTSPTVSPENTRPSGIVYFPGEDGKCDPWQNLDWCEDDDDTCMTSAPGHGHPDQNVGVQGCPGTGGPGGGGGEEPPPADTCQTGDPVLDDPVVKQGLKDLWTKSNPDAAQPQRLEQAGWIIQNADGSFGMAPFSVNSQGPCGVNGSLNAPPGAVAWVHTHPFTAGEVQTSCGPLQVPDPYAPGGFRALMGPDGRPVYPTYDNKPSYLDREVMFAINHVRSQQGRNLLAGVIIDANQTTAYSENPTDAITTFPRCGY